MTILPQLEKDLYQAAQQRLRPSTESDEERYRRVRMRPLVYLRIRKATGRSARFSPRAIVIGTLSAAALIGASVAAAEGVFSPSRIPGKVRAVPGHGATTVPPPLRAAFPLFGRERVSSDEIPEWLLGGNLAQGQDDLGINPGLSRLVTADSAVAMWLIPGSSGLCAVTWWKQLPGGRSSTVDCVGVASALRVGVLLVETFGVFGVVPHGTRHMTIAEGEVKMSVTPSPLGVVAVMVGKRVSSVVYTAPDGTRYVRTL